MSVSVFRKRNLVRLPTVGSPWYMAPETLTGKWYDERADVFSFGIILCELIARIASDPDVLPRTQNFGVDYVAFSEMCEDCPPDFLQLTFKCCLVEPKSRPNFSDLTKSLQELLTRLTRDRDVEAVRIRTKTPRFLDDVRLNQGPGKFRISQVRSVDGTRKTERAAYNKAWEPVELHDPIPAHPSLNLGSGPKKPVLLLPFECSHRNIPQFDYHQQ